MALPPPLTPEQRAEALKKAAEARRERAAIKARLKDSAGRRGEEIKKVLDEAESNEVIGRLRVAALLEALPASARSRRSRSWRRSASPPRARSAVWARTRPRSSSRTSPSDRTHRS